MLTNYLIIYLLKWTWWTKTVDFQQNDFRNLTSSDKLHNEDHLFTELIFVYVNQLHCGEMRQCSTSYVGIRNMQILCDPSNDK